MIRRSSTINTAADANIIYGTLDVNAADIDCATEDTVTFVPSAEIIGDYVSLLSNGTSWFISGSQASASGGMTCHKDGE